MKRTSQSGTRVVPLMTGIYLSNLGAHVLMYRNIPEIEKIGWTIYALTRAYCQFFRDQVS